MRSFDKVIDNIPFEQELILLKVDLKKIRKGRKGTVFFDDPSYMFGIFFFRISVFHLTTARRPLCGGGIVDHSFF